MRAMLQTTHAARNRSERALRLEYQYEIAHLLDEQEQLTQKRRDQLSLLRMQCDMAATGTRPGAGQHMARARAAIRTIAHSLTTATSELHHRLLQSLNVELPMMQLAGGPRRFAISFRSSTVAPRRIACMRRPSIEPVAARFVLRLRNG